MWDWLYGIDLRSEGAAATIGARRYDIDVVEGIVALMRLHSQAMDGPEGPLKPEHVDVAIRVQVRAPQEGYNGGWSQASMIRDVELAQVPNLSDSERERMSVTGAGGHVTFTRGWPAEIHANDEEFRRELVAYMRAEGKRLFPWWKVVAALPVVAGFVLAGVWVAEIAVGDLDGLLVTYGSIVSAGARVAGFATSRFLMSRESKRARHHRFRGGTRAEFRSAVTSVKAGVLTAAGGTVLGVILTVVFYKATGIAPV
ncbi:hypothetical protein [Curtobacterium sp. MCPF17_021]|uniref:hypothetical protein n=1 Tax=Curtobacterium sp. MCPF17_021 TaxID=2175639 RepID=UPI000DA74AA7|nr:hypothetical protein [Curtobacterium sp. MCPF17_021]WIE81737.1 hypothetical protein DEJ29_009920 [Curtobacterium sp. MCPF17_021]